jgi:hypothetical protein
VGSALWSPRRQIGTSSVLVEGDRAASHDEDGVWIDAPEFERLAGSEPLETSGTVARRAARRR